MKETKIINDCDLSLKQILTTSLPGLLKLLEQSQNSPLSLNQFPEGKKSTEHSLYKADGTGRSGCYLFFNNEENVYVGISRDLPKRIRNHYRGKTQYTSSFIYKIARSYRSRPDAPLYTNLQEVIDNYKLSKVSQKLHHTDAYRNEFSKARELIQTWKVAYVVIEDPITLYMFEAAAALHFNTYKYNCFRTH